MSSAPLPASLPLFPLTGALLLPGAHLPLNIFELRYLAMTRAALGEARLIGMIQPLDGKGDAGDPPLHRIGCAGKIVEFRETDDGRFLITLAGLSRFEIVAEAEVTDIYRRAEVDWRRFHGDLAESEIGEFDRARLLKSLGPFFARHGVKAELAAASSMPALRLVNALAMMAPFAPREKQALLESEPVERARLLIQLIEMSLLGGEIQGAGTPN
jgi:hypothetical protein